MPCPRYSILYHSGDLDANLSDIEGFLHRGVKVLWFGSEEDGGRLREGFEQFADALLLQTFAAPPGERFEIVDGEGLEDRVGTLSGIPEFNLEQYRIEHSADDDIMVTASAGTGKTKVMMDRVMYLLHTVDDLDPARIVMITFTNNSAEEMNRKLQIELMSRYHLTRSKFYLELLEKQSRMVISTIHSFAYRLIREYGIAVGFTKDVRIASLTQDVDRIIRDAIDGRSKGTDSVSRELGLPLDEVSRIARGYWDRLVQLGIPRNEIPDLEWGLPKDEKRWKRLQDTLRAAVESIDPAYESLKRSRNAVSLDDILSDLERILDSPGFEAPRDEYRYLFIDEFQDTDRSQIRTVVKLRSAFGLSTFVVGDVKQSIYRFRGADEGAFDTFKGMLRDEGAAPREYSLRNNYRTVPAVLDELDGCFESWNEEGLLRYRERAVPCVRGEGGCTVVVLSDKGSLEEHLVNDLRKALTSLEERRPGSTRPSDAVAVLGRTHGDLDKVAKICKDNRIPVIVKRKGDFYRSEAVRDFSALISSFLFRDPIHVFNYLDTPYAPAGIAPDLDQMISMNGDENGLMGYLDGLLDRTTWRDYDSMFGHHPPLFVIKSILDEEPVIENYVSRLKRNLGEGWDEKKLDAQVTARSRQYSADLDKLVDVLVHEAGASESLYSVHAFLDMKIRTDRDEQSPDVDDGAGDECVRCMTVHRAKGLEFDTVIIPYTDRVYLRKPDGDEMLVDTDSGRIGWMCRSKRMTFENLSYHDLRGSEEDSTEKEEARLLYVATTRTMNHLTIYLDRCAKDRSWAGLLMRGGM